ncbi:unnamed protein product [Cylicocyclus nassatus]|uniref:Kringle domain-containing protein n=1 Tax=Cylicocyclus nassatus TaxID=53992 RepID=A0AA36H1S9_CYLNA|nr:unnamed protein product [Cylicocyclus nassatus]
MRRAKNGRLNRDILEVRGLDGVYLPLCLTSARQEYVEHICTSSGSYLASYESIAISSPGSYAIACVGGANCFPYLNNYCKRGVAARCSKDYVDKRKIYFTSGYRGGSQWLWEDDTPIDFPVYGHGRCLAVVGGEFRAVECESPGIALCEVPRECIYHEEYYGRKNTTKDGLPCMKWNDPSVLYYGDAIAGQATWNHNFCRMLEDEDTPSCFSSPTIRNPCMIPDCPDSSSRLELKADLSSKCGPAFFACRDSGKCLPDDFRCDFEPDCSDASDEEDCEDYLKNFELVGTLKIADKITEIWTYIPHVQGV